MFLSSRVSQQLLDIIFYLHLQFPLSRGTGWFFRHCRSLFCYISLCCAILLSDQGIFLFGSNMFMNRHFFARLHLYPGFVLCCQAHNMGRRLTEKFIPSRTGRNKQTCPNCYQYLIPTGSDYDKLELLYLFENQKPCLPFGSWILDLFFRTSHFTLRTCLLGFVFLVYNQEYLYVWGMQMNS